jgi:hypothetical protein
MLRDIAASGQYHGWTAAFFQHVRRDAALHAFVAAYALAGVLVGIAAGVSHKFVPFAYVGVIPAGLAIVIGGGLWTMASGHPFAALQGALRQAGSPRNVAAMLLFAQLCVFMGVFSSVKTMLPDLVPFFADEPLANLDKLLHGRDPWQYSAALLPPVLTRALEPLYFGVWGVLLPGSILAVLLIPKLEPVRTQYVWTMLVIWPLLGNVVAGALMSAGPAYYEHVTGSERFADLVDYLERHSEGQQWAQAFLWKSYLFGEAGAGSGISAFPSMHVAVATLFVLLAARVHTSCKWVAASYCGVIMFGSVHLGWHYAVDGYFSIAGTVLVWKSVGWASKLLGQWPVAAALGGWRFEVSP